MGEWGVMVSEWDISIQNTRQTTEKTVILSSEELGKEVILMDAEKKISSLKTEWTQMYEFYLQLVDELEQAEYDEKAANEAIKFDLSKQIQVKGEVIAELERIVEYKKSIAVGSKVVALSDTEN